MKRILFVLSFSLNAYSAVLFAPDQDSQTLMEAYYKAFPTPTPTPTNGVGLFQTMIPSLYVKSAAPQSMWVPSIIVDIWQILNFNELGQLNVDNFELLPCCEQINLKLLNNLMYQNLLPHKEDWHKCFQILLQKVQEGFNNAPENKMLRKLLVGKNLLKNALSIELEAHTQDKMILWRFTTDFSHDLTMKNHTSFGLSLLGGYVRDGYIYDYPCGFSNLSACTYAYCANSLEAKMAGEKTDSHALYYVTIDQTYLSGNLSFWGCKNHDKESMHLILGTCPALAQVAWGRGEYFHPRLNPATFTADMIHKVDLNSVTS